MKKNKNVLFIMVDQFRADSLGHLGNNIVKTPNLDALAAMGSSFKKAFSQTSPCGPSRMCTYMSTYLCRNRTTNNSVPTFDAEENIGADLRAHGYEPKLLGYNDYALDPRILEDGDSRKTERNYDNVLPGFDWVLDHEYDSKEYFDSLLEKGYPEELAGKAIHKPNLPDDANKDLPGSYYPAHYSKEDSECWFITNELLKNIEIEKRKVDEGKLPGWFININYIKPHPPCVGVKEFLDLYDMADMPLPPECPDKFEDLHTLVQFFQDKKAYTDDWKRAVIRCYYAMITEVDYNIGRVLDALKQSNQLKDTIIVLTADHGEYNHDHNMSGKKLFFDQSIQVPLIIVDPSSEADENRGRLVEHLAETIDVAPTIIDLLGLPIPLRYQGKSHKNLLHSNLENYIPKESIFHEYDYRGAYPLLESGDTRRDKYLWVIRDAKYKYVQFADIDTKPILFDLEADPHEFKNLAADPKYASKVLELCQKLLRWRMINEDQRAQIWFDQV